LQYGRVTHLALKRRDDQSTEFWAFLRLTPPLLVGPFLLACQPMPYFNWSEDAISAHST
jgi:hypothetical protein